MKSNYVLTRVINETMLAIVFFSAYISFYNPCSLNPKTNNAWFSLWELSWHHNWLDMFGMQDFNQLSYAILMQIWHINTHTPLKINMESKNRPIAKENPLPNSKPLFLGSMLILQGLTCFTWQPEKKNYYKTLGREFFVQNYAAFMSTLKLEIWSSWDTLPCFRKYGLRVQNSGTALS